MSFKHITWAVEPFFDNPLLQRKTVKALRAITQGASVIIEPVYIHPPEGLNIPVELFETSTLNARAIAEQELSDFLKTIKLPGLTAPTFLTQDTISVRNAVRKLLSHARETASDLICVSTTSKKGMDRLFLGSFAEALLMQSEIPTLIVGPRTHIRERITQILFPTDFSARSRDVFQHTLSLAEDLKAKVILFHKVELLASYLIPYFPDPNYVNTQLSELQAKAEMWAESAKTRGIEAEIVIDETSIDVASGVVTLAKTMPSTIIAMASQTGPIVSALLGSVTRKVVRQSPCPVWTIHPSAKIDERITEKAA